LYSVILAAVHVNANIGDFEGFVIGVYLRATSEKQERKTYQHRSSAKPIFTPKFALPHFQTEHQAKLRCLEFFLHHSLENPSK